MSASDVRLFESAQKRLSRREPIPPAPLVPTAVPAALPRLTFKPAMIAALIVSLALWAGLILLVRWLLF